jgi:hypothetical protein
MLRSLNRQKVSVKKERGKLAMGVYLNLVKLKLLAWFRLKK